MLVLPVYVRTNIDRSTYTIFMYLSLYIMNSSDSSAVHVCLFVCDGASV